MKQKHPLAAIKAALQQSQSHQEASFDPVPADKIYHVQKPNKSYEKTGVLILAGGQGTRLGFDGPKGCFELPLKPKKSLFQIHLEKVKEKGENLSVAIMTSPLNDQATRSYLEEQNWFGLNPQQVEIFQQELTAMCDDDGYLVLDVNNQVVKAPNGNGKALFLLYEAGIWKKWKEKNITTVQIIPIDNPLATPFDEKLIDCHENTNAELVLKSIERIDPEEKIGVIGLKEKRLMIREYNEIGPRVKSGRGKDKKLIYIFGHSGLFSCSMNFIERMIASCFSMPWHITKKRNSSTRADLLWKFETFIFDLFPFADSYKILIEERKNCFAPLKNLSDVNSTLKALRRFDKIL